MKNELISKRIDYHLQHKSSVDKEDWHIIMSYSDEQLAKADMSFLEKDIPDLYKGRLRIVRDETMIYRMIL